MNTIKNKFLDFFKENNISLESKLLVGVSGGIDSMVCLDLARKCNKNVFVAHVNYKLRGKESDRDEKILKNYCLQWNIPFYIFRSRIDKTKNIQTEARKIRYSFFDEILKKEGLDFIVTAHHLNDNVETFFINALRGSGINGISGIPFKRDNIIRPLLCVNKKEIINYSKANKLSYGEDSTNALSDYKRNFIRNEILTLIDEKFEGAYNKINDTILNINRDKKLLNDLIQKKLADLIQKEGDGYLIKNNSEIPNHVWFHFFKEFGFNYSQILKWTNNEHQSGKVIYSKNYELSNNRGNWLLFPITHIIDEEDKEVYLDELIKNPFELIAKKTDEPTSLYSKKNGACLDFDKLNFPLHLCRWKNGDVMQPLGMKGSKKISDILIDKKVSVQKKKNIWVLKSKGEIIWLIGYTINDNFKVTPKTNNYCRIKINNN